MEQILLDRTFKHYKTLENDSCAGKLVTGCCHDEARDWKAVSGMDHMQIVRILSIWRSWQRIC